MEGHPYHTVQTEPRLEPGPGARPCWLAVVTIAWMWNQAAVSFDRKRLSLSRNRNGDIIDRWRIRRSDRRLEQRKLGEMYIP